MSERSVKCPRCTFSFASLVDAGGFRAYQCPTCEWTELTSDRRPGNRPADVCALCDGPIDLAATIDHHLYLGPGWVHGGGREYIPVHHSCLTIMDRYHLSDTLWSDDCSCAPGWRRPGRKHAMGCQHGD